MQLLFAGSEEVPDAQGFTILPGNVRRFQHEVQKVPHMGWNTVTVNTDCPVFADQPPETFFYFCHSYYCAPSDETVIAGTTTYGIPFAASVWQGTMFGVQFHPEKSQKAGLRVLEKFVRL